MDWLPFFDPHPLLHLAQAQTSAPSSPDLELLRKQLDFLSSENARLGADFAKRIEAITQTNKDLSESFKTFVETMKFVLVIFGFLGGAIAFIFGKNLDDAKKVARDAIRQNVDSHVTALVQTEIENVKRTLQRERVISDTIVSYYLPNATQPPSEYQLLKARGFREVSFPKDQPQLQNKRADVVVLDLENWLSTTLTEDQREEAAKTQIDALLTLLPQSSVLVIYVRRHIRHLNSVPRDRYVIAANNPVTLIGTVADAAYVVAGERDR